MKICIDITQAQYAHTGIGNYTRQLTSHLIDLHSPYQFTLFGTSLRQLSTLKEFVKAFPTTKKKLYPLPPTLTEYLFNQSHKLPIEILVGKVDVFHSSDWSHPLAKKAKIVTTIHDVSPILFPRYHHPKTIAVYKRGLEWVRKEAAMIITDSQSSKIDLINYLNVDESKIKVIYLGVSPQLLKFNHTDPALKIQTVSKVKLKYGLNNPYFLSVGTLEPRKNLKKIIAAFYEISKTNPDFNLVIVGHHGWGDEIYKYIPADLKPKIRLLGGLNDRELYCLYAGAEVFLYPSLYEGFGLPVLEAMTLGTPVVTSDRGSLKEVAGSAAVIVNPTSVSEISQGIITAIENKAKLAEVGRSHAAKFTWERTAAETMAVYESV
jgi:glycosyltransferase involved in cell wall biosynthesis